MHDWLDAWPILWKVSYRKITWLCRCYKIKWSLKKKGFKKQDKDENFTHTLQRFSSTPQTVSRTALDDRENKSSRSQVSPLISLVFFCVFLTWTLVSQILAYFLERYSVLEGSLLFGCIEYWVLPSSHLDAFTLTGTIATCLSGWKIHHHYHHASSQWKNIFQKYLQTFELHIPIFLSLVPGKLG